MNFTKEELDLIRVLGVSRVGLHIYTIFKKAGLAAPAMSKALASLQRSQILTMAGEVVTLSDKGRALLESRPALLVPTSVRLRERLDRAVPAAKKSEFRTAKVGVNELYVPRSSELPRSLLKLIADAHDAV